MSATFDESAGSQFPALASLAREGNVTFAMVAENPKRARKRRETEEVAPDVLPEMLARYVLVYGTDTVWDVDKCLSMRVNALRLAQGRRETTLWLGHPERRMITPDQVVFDPTMQCGDDCVNLFQGLPLEAKGGNCEPLLQLLRHLVSQADPDEAERQRVYDYVLDWLALPLQRPGTKMASALVFHGPQGTGKNLFFEAYARIFGEYAGVIGQSQLESRYNDWASRKLFLVADEVVASNELQHFKNALKSLITGESIQIETKFQPLRTERNHANLVFLSNDSKPLALERDDRRHLVVWCAAPRGPEFYAQVRESIRAGSVEALHHYLLTRELGDFHAHTPPPLTKAKGDLVELGLRAPERFAREWLEREIDLPVHTCSTGQLYEAFRTWANRNGERFPATQPIFTSQVKKYAGDRLESRKAAPSTGEQGPALTLWLPAGAHPPEGVRWYDYATEAVAAFDQALRRFRQPVGGAA